MSDGHDEYLWAGKGAGAADVTALERELGSLAWTPRPLALPTAAEVVAIRGRDPKPPPVVALAVERRNWAPLVAALAAAAAVFGVILWLRGPNEPPREVDPPSSPAIQPSARPPTPDLKDPFANNPQAGSVAPSLADPFAPADQPARRARRISPDLKDPFANSASSASSPPPPAPSPKQDISADLVDPFGGSERSSPSKQRGPDELYDPFTGKPAESPRRGSPDLKDPFKR